MFGLGSRCYCGSCVWGPVGEALAGVPLCEVCKCLLTGWFRTPETTNNKEMDAGLMKRLPNLKTRSKPSRSSRSCVSVTVGSEEPACTQEGGVTCKMQRKPSRESAQEPPRRRRPRLGPRGSGLRPGPCAGGPSLRAVQEPTFPTKTWGAGAEGPSTGSTLTSDRLCPTRSNAPPGLVPSDTDLQGDSGLLLGHRVMKGASLHPAGDTGLGARGH